MLKQRTYDDLFDGLSGHVVVLCRCTNPLLLLVYPVMELTPYTEHLINEYVLCSILLSFFSSFMEVQK